MRMEGSRARSVSLHAAGDGRDRGLVLVAALMLLYSALHVGFRLLASWSLGEDDPLENLLVQDLRWLYDPRQPPLYDWVLHAVQQVTGPTIVSFLAIKYAALIATGLFLYVAARRAFGAGALALMAVESLALIYQLSWRYHEGYTHQVGTMVAVAATMWAMLRVIDRQATGDFILLGLAAGLGLLTQPIFAVFLAAILLAVAAEAPARRRIFVPRLALVLAMTAAAAGVFLWHAGAALWVLAGAMSVPAPREALGGLLNAVRAPLFYLSPLILIVPLVFPGTLRRMLRDIPDTLWPATRGAEARASGAAEASGDGPALLERIVLRTSLIGFALSLAGAAALGLRGYASHTYMALYITAVVWLMGAVRRTRPSERALSLFGRLALAIAVFALFARLANMFVLDPVCKICRWGIPYDGLAAEIRAVAPEGALIASVDDELGGNLRALLPERRVVLGRGGSVAPATDAADRRPLVLVWDERTGESAVVASAAVLTHRRIDTASARVVTVPWRHTWRPTGYRVSTWRVLVVAGEEK